MIGKINKVKSDVCRTQKSIYQLNNKTIKDLKTDITVCKAKLQKLTSEQIPN